MRFALRRPPSAPPEDSVAIRVVVALAVEAGIVAVVLQAAVDPLSAVAALVLAPLGYLFSYRRRATSNLAVKVVLSVALLAALGQFLSSVRLVNNVDQARVPLASLFLWVQVLHAFDVPRRRDLAFSMVSSLTLVAAAGALSLTTTYLWVDLTWALLAATWLWLSARPRPDQVTAPLSIRRIAPERPSRAPVGRSIAAAGAAALILGVAVFMALPRLPAALVRTPPFSLGGGAPSDASPDEVRNPGLPSAGTDGVVDFTPDAYPGFSSAMDLRARGQLSDEIVFRVRADQATLARAEAFDRFDGVVWTSSSDDRETLPRSEDDGYDVPSIGVDAQLPWGLTNEVIQTFYIETPQPNVVFAAAHATRVYFPSGGLRLDPYGAIRSPILLDEGLVYSVVSNVPVLPPALLRQLPDPDPEVRRLAPYLQLPDSTPPRVGQLARSIVAGTTTEVDAVLAVEAWLRANTRYDLGVPREPDGVDAVDHFLFETKRGFCEHIASAMAVLLRSVGIPTRLVVGYGPGERNPLTGYFEVQQSDAHAWVEVWYPQAGWLSYDPTFGVPPAASSFGGRFLGGEAIAALARTIGERVPASVKEGVGAVSRGIASAASAVWSGWWAGVAIAAIGVVIALLRRRLRRARSATAPDDAGRAFDELVQVLARSGHPRAPAETPSELLVVVEADPALAGEVAAHAELVVRTFERARYAPAREAPSETDVMRALAAAERVRELVGR